MSEGLVIVINPAAGNGRCGQRWPALAAALSAAGLRFEAVLTTRPGEATVLAYKALGAGATTVVAVGGDGTANEVVNGFFEGDAPVRPGARFGLIPAGTGSDLARTLGLRGPAGIAALGPGGRTGTIDIVRVDYMGPDRLPQRRYFVNAADLGLGGETAALVKRSKALGGFLAFFVGAVQAILRHRARSVRYTIDGAPPVSARLDTIFVANGRYLGGGMFIAPRASVDDGEFDVVTLREVGKLDLLFRLLPAIYRGTHLRHPAVQHSRARRVRVDADGPFLLEIDGEQPGMAPAEFTILPQALPVALPPGKKSTDARL